MCVRWLRDKLGDFTLYGVNDGRYGRFHIDKKLAEIMSDEEARAVLIKFLPAAEQMAEHPMAAHMTLRGMKGRLPGVDDAMLQALDEELLRIR